MPKTSKKGTPAETKKDVPIVSVPENVLSVIIEGYSVMKQHLDSLETHKQKVKKVKTLLDSLSDELKDSNTGTLSQVKGKLEEIQPIMKDLERKENEADKACFDDVKQMITEMADKFSKVGSMLMVINR